MTFKYNYPPLFFAFSFILFAELMPIHAQSASINEQKKKDIKVVIENEKLPDLTALKAVSLKDFVQSFYKYSSTLVNEQFQAEILLNQKKQTLDRFSLGLEASAPLSLHYRQLGSPNQINSNLGGYELSSRPITAGIVTQDNIGGRGNISNQIALTSDSTLFSNSGQSFGASASYSLPLWNNFLGSVFKLENQQAGLKLAAQEQKVIISRQQQCSSALDFFFRAVAQEQQKVLWDTIMETKKRMLNQSRSDYANRYILYLDLLASKSDYEDGQSRYLAFMQSIEQRKAEYARVLNHGEYLDLNEEYSAIIQTLEKRLAAPLSFEEHPQYSFWQKKIQALDFEQQLIKKKNWGEVYVTPEIGLSGASQQFAQTGTEPYGDAYAQLAIKVELPIINPIRKYSKKAVNINKRLIQFELQQLERNIRSQYDAYSQQIKLLNDRLQHIQEQKKIMKQQIASARKRYRMGQMEFQDFLRHWQAFEQMRFQEIDLQLQQKQLLLQWSLLTGHVPNICNES